MEGDDKGHARSWKDYQFSLPSVDTSAMSPCGCLAVSDSYKKMAIRVGTGSEIENLMPLNQSRHGLLTIQTELWVTFLRSYGFRFSLPVLPQQAQVSMFEWFILTRVFQVRMHKTSTETFSKRYSTTWYLLIWENIRNKQKPLCCAASWRFWDSSTISCRCRMQKDTSAKYARHSESM